MLEAIVGSVVGLMLVWSGVYWVLWTSLFLTFLVHLRSEKSIEDGVAIIDRSWARVSNSDISRRFALVSLASAIAIAVLWIFLLVPVILDGFGWIGSYLRFVLLGFVSLNITVASVVLVMSLVLVFLTEMRPVPPPNDKPPDTLRTRTMVIIMMAATVLLPGAVAGVTGCFVIIRATATLMHLRDGISCFLQNWATLMLKTDIATEPELLPGLPDDHMFSFATMLRDYRRAEKNLADRYGSLLALAVFIPSMFYRLMLKSSFWFYAPLMWAAAPPRGLERDIHGKLRWDPTLARTPIDIAAALVALVGAFFFFFRVWDYNAYQTAATWAKDNDFPAYWPLLAAGINPSRVDIWYLLPGIGALLSLAVFVWAMQISSRARLVRRFPSQRTLWCLYKLNAAKNVLSISTVVVGFCFLLFYFGSNCLLPSAIQSVLSALTLAECVPL
ncbi:hypothetical protein [Roseovarius lutimaris]|nr:hypothetical protein [Roseovarius lutimaris]